MDNNRILVVDDEPDLTQVSTLALEYHGFKVVHLTTRRKRYQRLSLVS
jgi:DNA-binding response OmpR family regulator